MPSPFRRIALTAWPYAGNTDIKLGELVEWLRAKGFDLILDERVADEAGEAGGLPRDEVAEGADLVIVLGGDGSMLYAAYRIADDGPPSWASTRAASAFSPTSPGPRSTPPWSASSSKGTTSSNRGCGCAPPSSRTARRFGCATC